LLGPILEKLHSSIFCLREATISGELATRLPRIGFGERDLYRHPVRIYWRIYTDRFQGRLLHAVLVADRQQEERYGHYFALLTPDEKQDLRLEAMQLVSKARSKYGTDASSFAPQGSQGLYPHSSYQPQRGQP